MYSEIAKKFPDEIVHGDGEGREIRSWNAV
jgi:hypothetical protein